MFKAKMFFERALNNYGDNILHLAVRCRREQLVHNLLEIIDYVPTILLTPIPLIDFLNQFKQTSLHLAVISGQIGIVRQLLESNANPLLRDSNGNTPLHSACSGNDKPAIVDALLNRTSFITDQGCRIPELTVKNEHDGQTPLHIAAQQGCQQSLKLLINFPGIDINMQGEDGWTALHWTVNNGHKDCVSLLLAKGASVNYQDMHGKSPLQHAEELSVRQSKRVLKEHYKQVKDILKNSTQQTTLHMSEDEKAEMEFVEKHITEQGSLKLRVLKSVFYGAPATGKTCTRKRLTKTMTKLGSQAPLPSTGINKPCTVSLFHKTEQRSVLLTKSLKEWEEQDVETQCQTILEHIMLVSQNNSDHKSHQTIDHSYQDPFLVISPRAGVPSTAYLAQGLTKAVQTPARYSDLPPPPPLLHGNLQKGGALEKFVKSIVTAKQWKEIREELRPIEDMTILHITDTGGQPEFYDILPLLLQGPAIFLLFHNLTRPLHEHCEIRYRWEKGRSSNEYASQFTVKEMLFQLLVSVASPTSEEKLNTAVIFIGTYLDHVGAEGVLHQEKELKDIIQSTELFKKDVVKMFTQEGKKSLIFPLDNINGSSDEVEELRDFIAQVIEQTLKPTSIPTSWLLFHLVLRSLYETNPGYCTLEQCKEVAISCGIPGAIVVDILKFMHKTFGTILYYNDVPSLTDVVICDPNVIFMRATKLVTLSFGGNPDRPNTSEEIREYGEIDPSLMEEEKNKEQSVFSMSHVVELFTHYNIISQIKKFDGSHTYFMPCLLYPDATVGREEKHVLSSISPAPLLILFSTGYVPLGLFSALVVYLSKLEGWEIEPGERRYKNKIQFLLEKPTCTSLVLIGHIDRLELRIQSPESSIFGTICSHVVNTIKEAIETLKSCHKYLKFHNMLGFYCSSNLQMKDGAPHAAVCMETESPQVSWSKLSPKYMKCQCKTKCATRHSKLLDRHKIWFLQNYDVSASSSAKETLLVTQQPHISPVMPKADDNPATDTSDSCLEQQSPPFAVTFSQQTETPPSSAMIPTQLQASSGTPTIPREQLPCVETGAIFMKPIPTALPIPRTTTSIALPLEVDRSQLDTIRIDICKAIALQPAVIHHLADELRCSGLITPAVEQAVKFIDGKGPYEKADAMIGPVIERVQSDPERMAPVLVTALNNVGMASVTTASCLIGAVGGIAALGGITGTTRTTMTDLPPPPTSDPSVDILPDGVLDPLRDPPTLLDFLENVAIRIPQKWRTFGIAMNVSPKILDGFHEQYQGDQERCYEAIFEVCENQLEPLRWESLLKALRTRLVDESLLAEELSQKIKN